MYKCRYTKNPSLLAVELINEPLSPGVTLDSLTKYYRAGYDAVRKYSSTAYVIMSNRLGPHDPKELFNLASDLQRIIIDEHYYNLYNDSVFKSMTVKDNINFIYNKRSAQLNAITTPNGPEIFVGKPSLSLLSQPILICNTELNP